MAYGGADMNDGPARRGANRSTLGPSSRLGGVSRPNVLSDAAQPNRLSTQTGRPAPILTGRPTVASRPAARQPGIAPSSAGGQFERPARPRLSVSTLIFFGFIALTIFRCATRT